MCDSIEKLIEMKRFIQVEHALISDYKNANCCLEYNRQKCLLTIIINKKKLHMQYSNNTYQAVECLAHCACCHTILLHRSYNQDMSSGPSHCASHSTTRLRNSSAHHNTVCHNPEHYIKKIRRPNETGKNF